jgi:hypothetical protein
MFIEKEGKLLSLPNMRPWGIFGKDTMTQGKLIYESMGHFCGVGVYMEWVLREKAEINRICLTTHVSWYLSPITTL